MQVKIYFPAAAALRRAAVRAARSFGWSLPDTGYQPGSNPRPTIAKAGGASVGASAGASSVGLRLGEAAAREWGDADTTRRAVYRSALRQVGAIPAGEAHRVAKRPGRRRALVSCSHRMRRAAKTAAIVTAATLGIAASIATIAGTLRLFGVI